LAAQEVLELALRSGITCLIPFAVYGNVPHQKISFMANRHSETRLADANVAIDHENAAGWTRPASSL
jgi:hypothetical protein